MSPTSLVRRATLLASVALLALPPALAQTDYPSKPITMSPATRPAAALT